MSLKEKLRQGKKIHGTMIRVLRNPAFWYMAKDAGIEFCMMDCEHGHYDVETLHDHFLMARALGLEGFVRVPEGTKDWVSRVLDGGATGFMVPLVNTREYAEEIAALAKYPPLGRRGFVGMSAHVSYRGGKHADIMQRQNGEVIAIAQIETVQALENLDAIASVEGIDALLVGPNDLSVALGIPGDLLNPIELEAISKVAAACKRHGKAFGVHGGLALLERFGQELDIVMTGDDCSMLLGGMKAVADVHSQIGGY